jgi:hypothetical protein
MTVQVLYSAGPQYACPTQNDSARILPVLLDEIVAAISDSSFCATLVWHALVWPVHTKASS